MILCSNPRAQYSAHKSDIDKAIARVLGSGRYILGEEVHLFENEFARYIGVSSAIGVGSGTEALHIALRACGVGSGDEVITVSHTAVATISAIELCGARPVLVDVEPDFYTINPVYAKRAITKKTKAIIPVHIYGQPAAMKEILSLADKYGIKVIEDCAQAHGATYPQRGMAKSGQLKKAGAIGDIGCFSFYPTKNLGAIGDGGAVVTNDKKLADKVRLLREYGWARRYVSDIQGMNSRLDELQAAILRVKLPYLDKDNALRINLAAVYNESLKNMELALPQKRPGCTHVYHLYVVRSKQRNQLKDFLIKNDINTLIHYPVPIHAQPAYRGRVKIAGNLAVTEQLAKEVLSLPIYPELSLAMARVVVKKIRSFYKM